MISISNLLKLIATRKSWHFFLLIPLNSSTNCSIQCFTLSFLYADAGSLEVILSMTYIVNCHFIHIQMSWLVEVKISCLESWSMGYANMYHLFIVVTEKKIMWKNSNKKLFALIVYCKSNNMALIKLSNSITD